MTAPNRERLYELLPAIHRLRDTAEGEPLRALLGVMETEARRIENDIRGLYENWFIETCEDWIVPYIAELLGIRRLPAVGGPGFNQRTYVANTLLYRRRKGTHALIGDLARDVAGWPVRVVEMFRLVNQASYIAVPRSNLSASLNVRDVSALARLQTPFDSIHRTADVRRISEDTVVRYNLPNEAVFVWRIQTYRIENAPAGVVDASAGQYTFSVLGDDVPLYNRPAPDQGISGLEGDLPVALRRAALDEVLEAKRVALGADQPAPLDPYFDPGSDGRPPVFTMDINDQRVLPEQILIADLGRDWLRPPAEKIYRDQDGNDKSLPIVAVVDPRLGRIALATSDVTTKVRVSYTYGFSGDIGAGPYSVLDRQPFDPKLDRQVSETTGATIADGLAQGIPRLIEIQDNGVHELAALAIPAGRTLTIRTRNGFRPVLRSGTNSPLQIELGADSLLEIDGILLSAGSIVIVVPNQSRARLSLRRCTLQPGIVSLVALGGALDLFIDHCIVSDLDVLSGTITVLDSIVHGGIEAETLAIERSTVLRSEESIEFSAPVRVDTLESSSDTIFTRRIVVKFAQRGCMRYGYIPTSDSLTPPRFRCQPDLATSVANLSADDIARIWRSVEPQFTSTRFGHPGYGQLRRDSDEQIRRGASNGGEMGAFRFLNALQREENLRAAFDEYLRFGYDAGIFFVDESAEIAPFVEPAGLPWIVRIVPLAPLTAKIQDLEVSAFADALNADVRNAPILSRIDTPFELLPRMPDARRIAEESAVRHDLPNTAVFVWRLETYRLVAAPAGIIDAVAGHYTFSILRRDEPLFHTPSKIGDAEHQLPIALRRSALAEVVEALRQGELGGDQLFFAEPDLAFQIFVNGAPIPSEELLIVDMSLGFVTPPLSKRVGTIEKKIRAAVDPETGRFVLTNPRDKDVVRVTHSYGFSGNIGAGPYPGTSSSSTLGVEEFADNDRHALPALGSSSPTRIVRAGDRVRPIVEIPAAGRVLTLGQTSVTLQGLLFIGGPLELVIPKDIDATLILRQCTLPPGIVSLKVSGQGSLRLLVDRCVVGDIVIESTVTARISVQDSILGGSLSGGIWMIERSTVFGKVDVESLELARDSIFTQLVRVKEIRRGEIRFSYIGDANSTTPLRTSCQPDLAVVASNLDARGRDLLRRQIAPIFTSERHGDPGYGQLDRITDERIRRGGEQRGEMGAFQFLRNHRREQQTRLEYRINEDTGFFFIT